MKEILLEDDVLLENEEELNNLEYAGNDEIPIFETVRVTKKDFSVFELFRKYKKQQLIQEIIICQIYFHHKERRQTMGNMVL